MCQRFFDADGDASLLRMPGQAEPTQAKRGQGWQKMVQHKFSASSNLDTNEQSGDQDKQM